MGVIWAPRAIGGVGDTKGNRSFALGDQAAPVKLSDEAEVIIPFFSDCGVSERCDGFSEMLC